jgi:hypothetical protein
MSENKMMGIDKECCLHPGQPDFRCPECEKEQHRIAALSTPEEDKKAWQRLIKSLNNRGMPHEIRRHKDEDMPFGE